MHFIQQKRSANRFLKGIQISAIIIIGLFLLFFVYELWLNKPEIIIKTDSNIENAAISPEQAIQSVMSSDKYKNFDRWKRITEITVRRLKFGSDEDASEFDELKRMSSKPIDYDIYYIFVDSTTRCTSLSWLRFYVDPSSGEILGNYGMVEC